MPYLYRNDLEAIEKILLKELKPKKYSISCDGFEYEGVDEIAEYPTKTHVLVVYTHSPCMRLKFARSWAELYAGDDGDGMDAAIRKVAAIVTRAERSWLWFVCNSSSWLAPLIGFGSFAVAVGVIALWNAPGSLIYAAGLIMLAMSVWWGVGYRYRLCAFSSIDLSGPRKNSGWLQEHRASLAVFAVALVLGILITCLGFGFLRS